MICSKISASNAGRPSGWRACRWMIAEPACGRFERGRDDLLRARAAGTGSATAR